MYNNWILSLQICRDQQIEKSDELVHYWQVGRIDNKLKLNFYI